MKLFKAAFSGTLLIILLFTLHTKWGNIPPLGSFFDPQSGFWANAEISAPESEELEIPGLKDDVEVYFDERRVPHVFANNEHDLYLAQGYLIAKHRLFQLEMQTYDAAGRLAEILGPDLLSRDKQTRRWGLPYGAEQSILKINEDPKIKEAIYAYAQGVNAYIDELSPDEYPLEYKLLDIEPETWKPIKTALLLMNMTRDLGTRNRDVQSSNTMAYFGEDFLDTYISERMSLIDPIIPSSRDWGFEARVPEAPDSLFVPSSARSIDPFPMPEGVGSNNWAVSGSKTASGYPILANDPHLGLSLPSVWYEIQLNAPGVNTYGVTLQGSPGVIIGFNEKIAWGVTNVSSDILDWYEITFQDESKQAYWHDGQWKPTRMRVEEIKVWGEETVMDTVYYTHHGPVTEVTPNEEGAQPVYHAMRWLAHDGTNGLKTFYELNRAEDYEDYREAVKYWDTPAQNFAFASTEGDIALWVAGKFPKKWEYQGRTVSDGTDPTYDWHGWIPRDQVPNIKNPERGFVSSANQESAAPDYPYYLDDDFAPFERGRRINDLLGEMNEITPQDMQEMQMDDFNYNAATLLPELLDWVDEEELTGEEMQVWELMSSWDYHMDAEGIAPSIFQEWNLAFMRAVLLDEYNKTEARLRVPARDHFMETVTENENWFLFDDVNTEDLVETREMLATQSFKTALVDLQEEYGTMGDAWQWGIVMDNDIDHLASIPGFGRQDLFSSGSVSSINATRGGAGPSWRMIVEMGPEVKGWGVYPGGNSGNPGSPNYDSMVDPWRAGELFELDFMRERPTDYAYKISLIPSP